MLHDIPVTSYQTDDDNILTMMTSCQTNDDIITRLLLMVCNWKETGTCTDDPETLLGDDRYPQIPIHPSSKEREREKETEREGKQNYL